FEHFMAIAQAVNELGGTGLWDQEDGFYYDQAYASSQHSPLRIRSMVGLIPLFAAESLEAEALERLPMFRARLEWFLAHKPVLAQSIALMRPDAAHEHRLLAVPTRERLERVLRRLLDEGEFLSPFGVRSLSRAHHDHPCVVCLGDETHDVHYAPGESDSNLF